MATEDLLFGSEGNNSEYMSAKFDTQNDFISDITGGAVASVADFGASVYNSLPFTEEVSTADILGRVSQNALRVYEENPETIQTISFIGGSFIPGGFALKGMNMLRAGAKGASWFSDLGKVQRLERAEEAFKQGVNGTKAYRKVRRELFRDGILNNVADAAAMEVAILTTMNASPLLEDYFDEPVKNFGISLAFGGAIGGLAGGIATQFQLNKLVGSVDEAAFNLVGKDLSYVAPAEPTLGKLQIHESNIRSLEKITKPDFVADKRTKEIAEQFLLETRTQQRELFDKAVSPEIAALDEPVRNVILSKLANDNRIIGADGVKFFSLSDSEFDKVLAPTKIKNDAIVDTFAPVQLKDNQTQAVLEIEDVVYIPEFDRFSTVDEAQNYLRASSTGITEEALVKRMKGETGLVPNTDASFDYNTATAVSIDLKYLTALKEIDRLDAKGLQNLAVSPDDPYLLNAILAKSKKNPELFDNLTIRVTSNKPNSDTFQAAAAKQGKISPKLFTELTEMAGYNSPYNMLGANSTLSSSAKSTLASWVGGSAKAKNDLRKGMDSFLRSGGEGKYIEPMYQVASEIYNSVESVAMRAALKQSAAKEGDEHFIYLYRGIKGGKKVGHSPIESYTSANRIASNFGEAKLYKINVDDIIGTLSDGSFNEREFLIGSPARPPVLNVQVGSPSQASSLMNQVNNNQWNVKNIEERLLAIKESQINNLLERGVSLESISIRTNTPLESVKGFATGLFEGEGLKDLVQRGENFAPVSYGSADEIPKYLAPETRALRLRSNVNKLEFSKLSSQLDTKLGLNANTEYMEVISGTSGSNTMRSFHEKFFGNSLNPSGMRPMLDMLKSGVSEFNNSKLGNSFFQSQDFFLRNTSTGSIVTFIGKTLQDIATKSSEALTIPLTEKMAKVARNETALIEANTAMAVNASIKGPRVFKDGQFFVQEKNPATGKLDFTKAVDFNGKPYQVVNPDVLEMMDALAGSGRELYMLKNGLNRMQGKANLNDLGFWVPAFNPTGKSIAYVYDSVARQTKLLWGKTADELQENIAAYRATVSADDFNSGKIKIVENKQNQELWNTLNGRLDPLTMQIANVEKFHTGSSQSAIVRNNTDIFSEIIGGYNNYIESHVKQLGSMLMHDTLDTLGKMSSYNKRFFDSQPLTTVQKLTDRPMDGAGTIMNTLLGNSNLSTNPFWQSVNDTFETYSNMGLNTVNSIFKSALEPLPAKVGGKGKINEDNFKKLDYERISRELEREGIVNPWQAFDDEAASIYSVSKVQDIQNTSKRTVYASNAFAATFALRVLEMAQPIVNAMSLPILTSLAKAQNHPESFMGVKLKTSNVGTVQIMYEGARLNHSAEGARLAKIWEEAGYFNSYVSEANAVLRQSRTFEAGLAPKVENFLHSMMINLLSKPSDVMESIVRRQSMFTGAVLAKRLYPELDDAGVTIFARDFLDRAVGNYHAPQRPIFYQGTMGVALGLFQTYMLTMGQNIYRHLELKNYKALGKAALLQSSIFGTSSMPGFDMVSQAIGDNFSDDNFDLTSGTFRAIGDTNATAILYGLPSSIGPAFYTRGDLQPRGVNPLGGPASFAAVNMISQSVQAGANVIKAVSQENVGAGRALGEALSLQSVSRPIARVSELFTGYSLTGAGNAMELPEDVMTPVGISARLLSMRTIEEAKVREAQHLNTVYGQLDREHRQKVTKELKASIREGTLDNEKIAKLADDYFKNKGSPTGWRSAVNTAIGESNLNGKAKLVEKLKPDNPLMYMLEDLDGE